MLNSIDIKGLKGVTTKIDNFRTINVIVGDNACGKTAVLDAIRICLIGYVPRYGKQSTSALASGKRMHVIGEFETYVRKMHWEGVKLSHSCVPTVPFDPAESLDLTEFESKTKADKVNYLLSKIPADAGTPAFETVIKSIALAVQSQGGKQKVVDALTRVEAATVFEAMTAYREVADSRASKAKAEIETIRRVAAHAETNMSEGGIVDVIQDPTAEIHRLSKEIKGSENERSWMQTELASKSESLEQTVALAKELKANTANEASGCPCPTCGAKRKPLDEVEIKKLHDQTEAKLNDMRVTVRDMRDAVNVLTLKVAESKAETAVLVGLLAEQNLIRDRWIGNQGKQSVIDEAKVKLDQLIDFQIAWKEAAEEIKAQIIEVTKNGIGAVLRSANRLIYAVVGFTIEYNGVEFVKFDEEHSYKFMSDSERAVVSAGLQMAFSASSRNRIMVIDELAVLSEKNYARLMVAVRDLIQDGVIHQFFGARPSKPPVVEGVDVVIIDQERKNL